MANLVDYIGQKFGKLTVLSRAENSNANKRRYNCICECGGSSVVVASSLKNGRITTCGCGQREAVSRIGKSLLIDLTGMRFHRLCVVSRAENKSGKTAWNCICDCGSASVVSSGNLKSGLTKSCGCYLREKSAQTLFKHGKSRTAEYLKEKAKRKNERDRKNPLKLATFRIRDLIRKSLKIKCFNKNQKTAQILGCDYDFFKKHIERQFNDGMCWNRISEIHIDHIIPVATAKTIDEVVALCHFTNLRPVWAKDNLSKGAKNLFLI
jgi:hypothetical protein